MFLAFPPILGGYSAGAWLVFALIVALVAGVLYFVFRTLDQDPTQP